MEVISNKGPLICSWRIGLNGHIGLNEPGVDFNLIHVNDLATSTITSAQKHFEKPVPD